MKKAIVAGFLLALAPIAAAQGPDPGFAPEQVKLGSATYARHCAPCHGPNMLNPEGAFDLRTFPRDQRQRFVSAVMRGKGSMPPWADLLKADEVDALWAYLVAAGKE